MEVSEALQEPSYGRHDARVYRVKSHPISAGIVGVLLVPYTVYALIDVVRAGAFWLAVFVIIVAVASLTFITRAGLAAVVTTQRGVRVKNIRRTVVVPWEDVEGFSIGAQGILTKVGLLQRRGHEPIAMWAIQGPNPATRPNNRSAERMIERLNEELRQRRLDQPVRDASPSR